jgi:hypothetical protein
MGTSLTDGRYRWRHDTVLRELADWLETERKKERGSNPQHRRIAFVKPGETSTRAQKHHASILDGTTGWNLEVDLGRKLVFPDIVHTTLKPDIVLWSKTGKKLIVIELTVPWETRCVQAYERKMAKYTELLELCKTTGLAYLAVSRGSRSQRILRTVCVPADDSSWNYWQGETEGYTETEPSCRACL